MGIDALKGNQFLTLTKPQANYREGSNVVAYHQGRSEAPSYEGRGLFSNIDELEARKSQGSNFFATNPQSIATNNKGLLWGTDFRVPENNGTGQLRPVVDSDEIREIGIA